MKKLLFITLFCMVLLVGGISAFEFDNGIKYRNNDLTVDFENGYFYGIGEWFGFNEKIGEVVLKSHPNVNYVKGVLVGESVVMWYDFNFNEVYENGLGEIEIKNIKNGKLINKNWKYVYWGNETYEIPIYSEITLENGTKSSIIIGTETGYKEKWLDYNSKNIPKGKIRIGVKMNIDFEETLDIFWNVGGKKIEKHAVVTSGAVETTDGSYVILTYLNNGTFNVTVGGDIDVLIVAGGGGGGGFSDSGNAGGGGAGAYFFDNNRTISVGNYDVIVGTGGTTTSTFGGNGANSSFDGIERFGGGGGGHGYSPGNNGKDGGSGGGGSQNANGGNGNTGGNDGGNGHTTQAGGGGGGADAVGENAIANVGGDGGAGLSSTIYNGTTLWYAGGGGGGANQVGVGAGGAGGVGGGGKGSSENAIQAVAGVDGTGGGGGGGGNTINGKDGGNGIVIIRYLSSEIIIQLTSPENNTNLTSENVELIGNITSEDPGLGILNVSLLINGTVTQTNTSGIFGTYNFSETLIDGDYNWTIISYGNNSEQYNTNNGTLFFNINLTEPTITLIEPLNDSITSSINNLFIANITGNSFNITNSTLEIWFSNGTLFNFSTNTTIIGTGNSNVSINMSLDGFEDYYWNFLICGNSTLRTSCVSNETNFSLKFSPFSVNSITYDSSVMETDNERYVINISANPLVSSVSGKLWYNGSDYTASLTNANGIYISNDTIDVPLGTENSSNKSFFWQFDFVLTDGTTTQENSSSSTQEVNRTYLELCNTTFNSAILNFTTKNAENPFPIINATFKTTLEWYLSTGTGTVTRNNSYEDITENNSEFDFCYVHPGKVYLIDSDIEYDATDFVLNFYYLRNASLSNATQEIDLHLLNNSKATATVLKVRGDAQRPIEDAIIQIQLYDIGTGTYQTVAMGETSFDGEDIVYLNWIDSLYKFIITKNGEVLKSTQPYKIGESPQLFDILTGFSFSFNKFRDFQYSLTFNNATDNFILTYTKPSGEVDEGCLRVIKRTAQNDTTICETCETSSSATLFCNIANEGNGTYIGAFYATGSADLVDWIVQVIGGNFAEEIYEELGIEDATAYAILLGGLIFGLFLITPVLGILGMLLGIFASAALGFTQIDYLTYMGIAVLGGIIIWILKR